jgi:hypothetical protein
MVRQSVAFQGCGQERGELEVEAAGFAAGNNEVLRPFSAGARTEGRWQASGESDGEG